MRDFKFRAWCESTKKMTHFDCHGIISSTEMESGERWGLFFPASDAVFIGEYDVMQFTGLLDCKGKEIWEGDIIYVPYNGIDNQPVRFVKGAFDCAGFNLNRCHVVGNIYENGDLLKS